MRSVLRSFADAGGTVLLSSHLLREVEAVADDVVIIGGGRILAAGSVAELLGAPGTLVRSTDDAALARALVGAGHDVDPLPTACPLPPHARRSAVPPWTPASSSPTSGRTPPPAWRTCSSRPPPSTGERRSQHDRRHGSRHPP